MRALRILLIVVVVLGGLFVLADRLAVHFAEGEAADKLRTSENLASTPDVSIKGFPFLTQVVEAARWTTSRSASRATRRTPATAGSRSASTTSRRR